MIQDLKKWNQGVALLSALMQNIPSSADEDAVDQFHSILALLEEASAEDLSLFRISPQRLGPRVTSFRPGGYGGGSGSVTYSKKRYCENSYFRFQVHGLSNYMRILQSKPPNPTNPYEILSDDELKDMLQERGIKPKKKNGTPGFDRPIAIIQLVDHENPKPTAPSNSTVINVHGAHSSNFNVNSPGASITQTNDYRGNDFRELLAKLRRFSTASDLPRDQQELVRTDIEAIEVQIGSTQPKVSIIRECLLSAKTILENAAGTLLASALASQILPDLQRYLP
jgi:hypothetical protein